MWLIRVEGEDLGNPNTNQFNNDALIANFSLFRGPNIVNWYCRQTSNVLLTKLDSGKPFQLLYFEQNSTAPLFTISMKLEAVNWHDRMNCFEYTFIPLAYYFLRADVDVYIDGTPNLKTIITQICNKASNEVKLVLDNKLAAITYKGYHGTGKAIDLIADLCSANGQEFACISNGLFVGPFIGSDVNSIYKMIDNTICHYNSNNVNYHSGRTIGQMIPPPGTTFGLQVLNAANYGVVRNIYTSYRFTDKEMRCVFVSSNKTIGEQDLYRALPAEMRNLYKPIVPKSIVQLGEIVETAAIEDKVCFDNYNNDKFNLNMMATDSKASVIHTSPYAGTTVGIQFPVNKNVEAVIVNPDERKDMALEVAQLFQGGTVPRRTSPDDFRLTLPDGGTLYYSKSAGSWILAAKTKVLIGQDNVSSSSVPSPGSNYIEITSLGVKICGSTNLATANHTHIYEHIQVATAPGAPTAPQTVQAIPLPVGPKTSTPDKVTLKVKGDETTQVQS